MLNNDLKINDLIWLDTETTGLDAENGHRILELAIIVTDSDLNIVAESEVFTAHQSEFEINKMSKFAASKHFESGLIDRVRASCFSDLQVQEQALDFLRKHAIAGLSPMCGNSIAQDRRFLRRYMPRLEAYFHYQNLDVSTIQQLWNCWRASPGFKKTYQHEALADIRESIAELKFYRENFMLIGV